MSEARRTQGLKGPQLRTVLFVPGSNARALEKARTLACDALILDLEDAVGPGEKQTSRAAVAAMIAARAFGKRYTVVRINALTGEWGADDLKAAAGADAILLPKLESEGDLGAARLLAPPKNNKEAMPLWAMIETPRAVLALERIAAAAAVLVLGANDLLKAMGGRQRSDGANLHYAMAALVTAARGYGALALDGVHNDIADTDGFAASCTLAHDFGFDGKTLIHPSQIEPARAAFAPSAAQIAQARALLAEFAKPENAGKGVIAFEGAMVERLHEEMARRLLDEGA